MFQTEFGAASCFRLPPCLPLFLEGVSLKRLLLLVVLKVCAHVDPLPQRYNITQYVCHEDVWSNKQHLKRQSVLAFSCSASLKAF